VVSGMERMICALDPAVAVVAVPDPALPVPPRTQLAAALGGRATPCFLHDPAAGPSWADRFELAANPQPETAWPESLTFCVDDGERVERREAFTFAHAIALDPAYRAHLGVLPRDAWSDAQIEIADWLERPRGARRRVVPFIWVALDDGTLARAAVTRELAAACQDRLRSWHVVQELAGTDNAYVQRAAEAVLAQAKDDAAREIETVERTWADKLERARADGANDAMNRLVQILLDMDSVPAPSTAPSPEPPPPSYAEATEAASPPPAAAEPAAAIEEQEDEPSFDEAYVDSVLCTTCNECINLNPRLFAYNANRQAEIADASAGTFEQLVKAAEKCPARCIHPGAPRAGDETATDEVVARVERFR